jgi:hypothetical protein
VRNEKLMRKIIRCKRKSFDRIVALISIVEAILSLFFQVENDQKQESYSDDLHCTWMLDLN